MPNRQLPSSEKQHTIVLLRGMLVVAVGGLLLDAGIHDAGLAPVVVLAAFALSDLLLRYAPPSLVGSPRFELAVGGADLVLVGLGIYLSGTGAGTLPVSCLLMTLVVALGGHRLHAVGGATAVGALHAWLLLTIAPAPASGRQLLLQILFLCSVGLYYATLTGGIHSLRHEEQAEEVGRRDLTALVDILDRVGASLDQNEIARTIVGRLSTVVPSQRCSLMWIDPAGRCYALASHDVPQFDPLELDLGKYPEVRHAIATRQPVVIGDVLSHPLTADVREKLKALDFQSIVVIPLTFGDDVLGMLCLRAARIRGAFSEREIKFCQAVARAAANAIKNAMLHRQVREESESLRTAQTQLLQAEKLSTIGEVISGVAHELNNPLSGVLGFSQLLLARHGDGPLARELERIHEAALRCQRIVKNLLSFSRVHKPERRHLGLNGILEKTLDLKRYQLEVKDIELVKELDPGLPMTLLDFHQMQQVFLNLLNNAEQAITAARQPGRVVVRTRFVDGQIHAEVTDNGIGMDGRTLERIFDPFFSTKGPGQGTGLGLSVSYGIVKEHGGRIHARSRPGAGSTFFVELPVFGPEPAAAVDEHEPRATQPGTPPRRSNILVVDDEPMILDLAVEVLEELGHRVDTAANGSEAYRKVSARTYDMVITDMRMPQMGGMELHRRIMELRPELKGKVVFVTGDLLDHETSEFLVKVQARTIAKPFETPALVDLVRQTLAL